MTNKDYIRLYIEANCNSENTKVAYTADLNSMIDFVKKPIEDIEAIDILNWKNSMANGSSATMARKLGTAKRFFSFLFDNSYLLSNPTKAIKLPRIVNKEEGTLTKEDVRSLINACKNTRDVAILSLMVSTGLRVSELCNIMIDDIDENNNIKILGKGSKWRVVHLNNKTTNAINHYLPNRKDGCRNLFVSNQGTPMTQNTINHTLKTLARRANLDINIHPHMFRHYACTTWIENGAQVQQAQVCLGHSNISTTMRYFEQRNKRQVVEDIMEMEVY